MKKAGMIFLAGAAAGYAVSLFMPNSMKREQKEMLEEKTRELQEILSDPEQQAKIKEIFSKNTRKAQDIYGAAKDAVILNLARLDGSLSSIDKNKYMEAVKEAVGQVKDEHSVPSDQLKKLAHYLERDFDLFKANLSHDAYDVEELDDRPRMQA